MWLRLAVDGNWLTKGGLPAAGAIRLGGGQLCRHAPPMGRAAQLKCDCAQLRGNSATVAPAAQWRARIRALAGKLRLFLARRRSTGSWANVACG